MPAWIHSLKSTCSVHCHTAIQHHSITYNINDHLSLEAENMAIVPTCGSSLCSSHGIVWVACLWKLFDFILVLRCIFISHFISSSDILKTTSTVEVYVCMHVPINCTLLTTVYWATIYTPAGIVTYNSTNHHIMWCDDRTVMIQEVCE